MRLVFDFLDYYGTAEHKVLQEVRYTNYYQYYQHLTAEIKYGSETSSKAKQGSLAAMLKIFL